MLVSSFLPFLVVTFTPTLYDVICDVACSWCLVVFHFLNPNTIKSYKILQKLSPKHAAHGVAQSPYPIYRHRKACLSKQPPSACSPRPSPSTRQVPGPVGALRALFSPPSLPSSFGFFRTFPTKPTKVLGLLATSASLTVTNFLVE